MVALSIFKRISARGSCASKQIFQQAKSLCELSISLFLCQFSSCHMPQNDQPSGQAWVSPRYPASIDRTVLPAQTPGLRNFGNTGYLNAALQCIFHTPALASYLYKFVDHQLCEADNSHSPCLRCELGLLAKKFFKSKGQSAIRPKELLVALHQLNPEYTKRNQKDANEFLTMLFDKIGKRELAQMRDTDPSVNDSTQAPIAKILNGLVLSAMTCATCTSVHETDISFSSLSISIDENQTVTNALREHFATIPLQNKVHCSNCRKRTTSSQRDYIRTAPNVFLLNLARMVNDTSSSEGLTDTRSTKEFAETLDLAKYMEHESNPNQHLIYTLTGMIVHQGESKEEGHYTAYVKSKNGIWFLKDDDDTLMIPISRLQKQKPYMLFYSRDEGAIGTIRNDVVMEDHGDEELSSQVPKRNTRVESGSILPNAGEERPTKIARTLPQMGADLEFSQKGCGIRKNTVHVPNVDDQLFLRKPLEYQEYMHKVRTQANPVAEEALIIPPETTWRYPRTFPPHPDGAQEILDAPGPNEIIRFVDQLPMTSKPLVTLEAGEGPRYFSSLDQRTSPDEARKFAANSMIMRKLEEKKRPMAHRSIINPKKVYWKPKISSYTSKKYKAVYDGIVEDETENMFASPFNNTKLYSVHD